MSLGEKEIKIHLRFLFLSASSPQAASPPPHLSFISHWNTPMPYLPSFFFLNLDLPVCADGIQYMVLQGSFYYVAEWRYLIYAARRAKRPYYNLVYSQAAASPRAKSLL